MQNRHWTVRRMVIAGYWDASALFADLMTMAALMALPPPADSRLHVIVDKTIKQKAVRSSPQAIRPG
ncbi:MAG: hypothetical protein J2P21_15595 [Chloracidobacterium sp.]|nr:hypothetical protein [Chloracidobacterium sp.]